MLLIPCPHCGRRAQTEFDYGGDASVARPGRDGGEQAADAESARQWLDHIYIRDNLRGPHLEWWQHSSGCRAWIKVQRNTATHQILGAWRATETIAADSPPGQSSSGSEQ
jgi:heterotetrameric sarcosine oxidase delta subunit